jgi:hypothetical protein
MSPPLQAQDFDTSNGYGHATADRVGPRPGNRSPAPKSRTTMATQDEKKAKKVLYIENDPSVESARKKVNMKTFLLLRGHAFRRGGRFEFAHRHVVVLGEQYCIFYNDRLEIDRPMAFHNGSFPKVLTHPAMIQQGLAQAMLYM